MVLPPAAGRGTTGCAGEVTGERLSSSSIRRSVAPAARSRSPYTSPSTPTAPARIITYTTVSPRWPAVMVPARTACVPWYSPHSSRAAVEMMMKATSTARARVRRMPVWNALSVAASKRAASRDSAV